MLAVRSGGGATAAQNLFKLKRWKVTAVGKTLKWPLNTGIQGANTVSNVHDSGQLLELVK